MLIDTFTDTVFFKSKANGCYIDDEFHSLLEVMLKNMCKDGLGILEQKWGHFKWGEEEIFSGFCEKKCCSNGLVCGLESKRFLKAKDRFLFVYFFLQYLFFDGKFWQGLRSQKSLVV